MAARRSRLSKGTEPLAVASGCRSPRISKGVRVSSMQAANQNSTIHVRVLFFGASRDAVGEAEINFELSSPTNAASALEQLLDAYPALRSFGKSLLFAVNQ